MKEIELHILLPRTWGLLTCVWWLGAAAMGPIGSAGDSSMEVRGNDRLIRSSDPPPRRSGYRWSLELDAAGAATAAKAVDVSAAVELEGKSKRRPATKIPSKPLSAECLKVIAKAEKLMSFYAKDQDKDSRVHNITAHLKALDRDKFVLDDVLEALANVSLATALQTGAVWTVEDQRMLYDNCLADGFMPALEEYQQTPSNDSLFQGDMLVTEGISKDGVANVNISLGTSNWPNGRVPYCFASDISKMASKAFAAATSHIQAQVPCVSFPKIDLKQVDTEPLKCAEHGSVHLPKGVTIKSAWYGLADDVKKRTDITEKVKKQYADGESEIHAKSHLWGDPAPGKPKVLEVRFSTVSGDSCSSGPSILVSSSQIGCWSQIGPQPKNASQKLNLGRGCELMGMAAHQLMQAMGMTHELSHPNRDEFVDFDMENTNVFTWDSNFQISGASVGPSSSDFDPLSLMMGSAISFSENGKPTIGLKYTNKIASRKLRAELREVGEGEGDVKTVPKKLPLLTYLLGQRMGLSEVDARRLGERYGCANEVKPKTASKRLAAKLMSGGGLKKGGECADTTYTGIMAQLGDHTDIHLGCLDLKDKCLDPELSERLFARCPLTCMSCMPKPEEADDEEAPGESLEESDLGDLFVSQSVASLAAEGVLIDFDSTAKPCEDANYTGIKHKVTKANASCAELKLYCNHADIGEAVEAACTKTCGLCDVRKEHNKSVPAPTPVPSWRCHDSPDTGIRFHGGDKANCSELFNYCNMPPHADKIKEKCPLTCGLCAPQTTVQVAESSNSTNTTCEDIPADRAPVLWMGNKAADCAGVKAFCFGHPNSKYVINKCKVTCGVCNAPEEELEEAEDISTTIAAPAVQETTISIPNYDGFAGPECTRRRRWGFCSTRRRRDNT